MKLTDIFINRPVLATVISLVILLLGIRAGMDCCLGRLPGTRGRPFVFKTDRCDPQNADCHQSAMNPQIISLFF